MVLSVLITLLSFFFLVLVYAVQGSALDSVVRNTLSLLYARVCLRDEASFDVITRERRVAYRAENGAVRTMWLKALKVCSSIYVKISRDPCENVDLLYQRNIDANF